MGHHHNAGLFLAENLDRPCQRGISLRIQVGVGFIEHDKGRVSKDGTRQCNALHLATGKDLHSL